MGEIDAINYIFGLVDYVPTAEQAAIHADPSRNKLITGGERGGKSKVNSKELLKHWYLDVVIPHKEKALYWLLGADYEACRGEWEHIVEDFQKLGQIYSITKDIDPGELIIKNDEGKPQTTILTKSAKYKEKIATVAPDGILGCEAAQLEYEIYLRSRSRVAEKRGWVSMAGTLEEEDYVSWYRELYELGQSYNQHELKSFSLPTWSNLFIFPGGRQDPELLKLEAEMTPERFMERFGGVPAPKSGRVVTEFANHIHVKPCQFDTSKPVEIAVDPGYAGASVVMFIQDHGDYLAVFDEIYIQGKVTQEIIDIAKKMLCWRAIGGGGIDIAGKQHQAMPAPIELWRDAGISLQCKRIEIEDGIDLLRTRLKQHPITGRPGIIFDPKCRGLISECGGGRSPVEGGGIWMRDKHTNKPLAVNDHACKAMIYYLANKYGYSIERKKYQPLKLVGRRHIPTFAR